MPRREVVANSRCVSETRGQPSCSFLPQRCQCSRSTLHSFRCGRGGTRVIETRGEAGSVPCEAAPSPQLRFHRRRERDALADYALLLRCYRSSCDRRSTHSPPPLFFDLSAAQTHSSGPARIAVLAHAIFSPSLHLGDESACPPFPSLPSFSLLTPSLSLSLGTAQSCPRRFASVVVAVEVAVDFAAVFITPPATRD